MTKENAKQIESRKASHLEMSEKSQTYAFSDQRFTYEPLFAAHPPQDLTGLRDQLSLEFLNQRLGAPLWVSSMTGGSLKSRRVNEDLARMAHKFGLGMGLGSCRPLLSDFKKYFNDFNLRPILGSELPLWANLGIAQIDELLQSRDQLSALEQMLQELKVNGLIIHLNLLQEWAQPEGDFIRRPLLETLTEFTARWSGPLIFKEVGHGFGPKSLKALFSLNPLAIETAAFGGTNFTLMEQQRHVKKTHPELDQEFTLVGHNLEEMLDSLDALKQSGENFFHGPHRGLILSGGLRSPLDVHYALERSASLGVPSVAAMAYPFLKALEQGPDHLDQFVFHFLQNLCLARQCLRLRTNHA